MCRICLEYSPIDYIFNVIEHDNIHYNSLYPLWVTTVVLNNLVISTNKSNDDNFIWYFILKLCITI